MLELATLIFPNARYRTPWPSSSRTSASPMRSSRRASPGAANLLRSLGVGVGDKVAMVLGNSLEALELGWTVPAVGAALVPLSPLLMGGMKVYPRDVEEVVARHPAVREVAVFGVPHEKWGETPVAAVVLRQPGSMSADELRACINERVGARYQRVSEVLVLQDFPRSAAGKTLKRELRAPYWAGRDRSI